MGAGLGWFCFFAFEDVKDARLLFGSLILMDVICRRQQVHSEVLTVEAMPLQLTDAAEDIGPGRADNWDNCLVR